MRAITQFIKQRKILLGIIILVIAGGIYWYTQSSKSSQQAVQYQFGTAEKGTLVVAITGSGKISTANSTSITTDIGGVVEEVYVKSGDYVQAGTPLAKIQLDADSQQRQSESYASYLNAVNQATQSRISKASAQNTLEAARQAVLEAAQDVAELDEDLATDYINPATKNRYTQNEIDVIRSKLTQARLSFSIAEQKYSSSDTTIAASNASLTASKLDYQNMTNVITAPVAGTLSNFTIQKGDTITVTTSTSSTSNSSTTPQKVATLNTGNKPSITINLSEIDVPKVKVGNKVTITVDAFPDKSFTGMVSDIDTTGSDSSGVVSYPVTITTDTPNDQLYANMSVTANIITTTKSNVLLVPSSAVQKINDQATVSVMKNGQVEVVTVEIGESSDTQVEITSGLTEGDQVVTSSTNAATNTQRSGATSVFSTGGFGGVGGNRSVRIQTR
jgi:RND family efflux transporter MFP subunit